MPPQTTQTKTKRTSPTTRQRTQTRDKLRPTINGPKLRPFRSPFFRKSSDFRFEELLNEESSGQGYVFRATLNGGIYAVKLFKFFDVEQGRKSFWKSQSNLISDEEFAGNLDPFYAECRAYGRIEEIYAKYEGIGVEIAPIAVPCYGYISITKSHERRIVAQFGPLDFQRLEEHTHTEIRALVKEYVPHSPLNPKKRPIMLMLQHLETMHENGLYPIDVREENYRDGLLVDFGMALTEPSCVLRVVDEDIASCERATGFDEFDKMIRNAGIKTRIRATEGPGWRSRTRAGAKSKGGADLIELENSRGARPQTQRSERKRRN